MIWLLEKLLKLTYHARFAHFALISLLLLLAILFYHVLLLAEIEQKILESGHKQGSFMDIGLLNICKFVMLFFLLVILILVFVCGWPLWLCQIGNKMMYKLCTLREKICEFYKISVATANKDDRSTQGKTLKFSPLYHVLKALKCSQPIAV